MTTLRATSNNFVTAECLGNPLPSTTPASGQRIVDLQLFDDKVYIGYGNWAPNSGPIDILYCRGKDFASENCGSSPALSEEETRYIVSGGRLYIPGIDPQDDWSLGNFYRYEEHGWAKHRTIPHGIHTFAIAEYKCGLFVGCGVSKNTKSYALQRSDDDGNNWVSVVDPALFSSINRPRFNQLFAIQDQLVATGFSDAVGQILVYNRTTSMMKPLAWPIIGDLSNTRGIKKCVVLGGDRVLAIPSTETDLYMADYGHAGKPLSKHNDAESVVDLVVSGQLAYVLCTVPSSSGGYSVGICSVDHGGINRGHVGTRVPHQPLSFAVRDSDILLGDNDGNIFRIDRCGI